MSETPLFHYLRRRIAAEGPISFRDFMAEALYHPGHGYYGSGTAKIGVRGDFFTSVSVGALFGRLLARQFEEMWRRLDRPSVFDIVEQGGHHGDFAGDVLGALEMAGSEEFAQTVRFTLVEPSEALRAQQQAKLAPFASRVRWAGELAELDPIRGVHFSNELVDAFPVHRVLWTGSEWLERCVALAAEGLQFVSAPLSDPALRAALAKLPEGLPEGYETEINLAASHWARAVADRLRLGWILAIDYGYPRLEYFRPERMEGTLSAYRRHQRVADPLEAPGEIDLTAHVEFTSLAEAGQAAGLRVAGYADQHRLMAGLSRLYFTEGVAPEPKEAREFKTLMHPEMMGASFKALCLETAGIGVGESLAGFSFAGDPRLALGLE